jgi:pyruvate/2-oxoglutarate dehydrogenase complex dihydrolipoamide acyltransferase (E2) component
MKFPGNLGQTDMPRNTRLGPHKVVPFRPERNATLDSLRWASRRLQIPILLEVEVAPLRRALREYRNRTGKGLSLTAWVVSCVARAAAEHPRVHGARLGARRLVTFEEVDVAVLVERAIGEEAEQETLPMPVVVRNAHEKDPWEIHDEIQQARHAEIASGAATIEGTASPWVQSLFFRLPRFLRDWLFWRWLLRNPMRIKKTMGTVVVTSAGMATPGTLSWGIPSSIHPLAIGVGGIARRGSGEGKSEVLGLTVVFDHAVTDGAPVGRFIHRFQQLLTQVEGLKMEKPGGL